MNVLRTTTTRVAAGALAGIAVVGGVLAASTYTEPDAASAETPVMTTVAAVDEDDVVGGDVLSTDAVATILQAAQDAADERGVRITVAVVDRAGNTIGLLTGNGAGPQTVQSAIDKAFTSVSFGRPTSELAKNVNGNKPTIGDIPGTLFLAGGVPVTVDDLPIAGIGIGGAPDGAIDEEIAEAAIAALG